MKEFFLLTSPGAYFVENTGGVVALSCQIVGTYDRMSLFWDSYGGRLVGVQPMGCVHGFSPPYRLCAGGLCDVIYRCSTGITE